MRKKTRPGLLIPVLCCFSAGFIFTARAQDVASNNYRPIFASVRRTAQNEPMVISLKDAINQLKSFYSVKVAYKEGLLDNKIVPVAVTGNFRNMDVETALKQLFSNTTLIYKKIGNNQFLEFDSRTVNALPPAELMADFLPISGKVTG